jgi:hypothetical protein
MARNVWQGDVGIVAHPTMPIAATYATRFDFDNDPVGRWRRIGQRFDCRPFGKPGVVDSFHS